MLAGEIRAFSHPVELRPGDDAGIRAPRRGHQHRRGLRRTRRGRHGGERVDTRAPAQRGNGQPPIDRRSDPALNAALVQHDSQKQQPVDDHTEPAAHSGVGIVLVVADQVVRLIALDALGQRSDEVGDADHRVRLLAPVAALIPRTGGQRRGAGGAVRCGSRMVLRR